MRREDPKYVKKRQEYMAKQKAMSQDKFNKGGLTGNQKKLDKNNNNRIDAQDFKILKAEKAKGRGQGLQDEKMKPGKIMKARVGKSIRVKDDDSFSKKYELQEKGVIDKKTGTGRERVAKAVKATRVGKILLPIVGAGVAAHQFLKSKMKKDKKMGGGMMQKPMGYVGGGPAEESDLARRMGQRKKKPKAGVPSLPGKKKDDSFESIIITKGGIYAHTKPEIEEKKGKNYRQHKSYDASPRLISDAKGKTMSLRSMNVGGSVSVKTKLGRNKPTKLY